MTSEAGKLGNESSAQNTGAESARRLEEIGKEKLHRAARGMGVEVEVIAC